MHCDKDHHREFAALKDLAIPDSQRMEVRHKCAACAMEAGRLAARREIALQLLGGAWGVRGGARLAESFAKDPQDSEFNKREQLVFEQLIRLAIPEATVVTLIAEAMVGTGGE